MFSKNEIIEVKMNNWNRIIQKKLFKWLPREERRGQGRVNGDGDRSQTSRTILLGSFGLRNLMSVLHTSMF